MGRTDSSEPLVSRGLRREDRICPTAHMACVDLPALPLQLLLRQHPDWRGRPSAVVAADDPQALLQWVSESARQAGILPGMRYVAALALDSGLRAAPVSGQRVAGATAALHRHLLRYSPRVEPAAHEPGVFWLDAGGLERVGGTPAAWAERLWRGLRRARFVCGVTVGFSRFGTYCLSRIHRRTAVLTSAARERESCQQVALARLDLPPRVRDDLARLGVETVRDLVALPVAGLAARFGAETASLVLLAQGLRFDPLQPVVPVPAYQVSQCLDQPESDAWRLLFLVKHLMHPLLGRLALECQAVSQLHLDLTSEARGPQQTVRESLRPAAPTLDVVLLTELVRLRLERLNLSAGVVVVALELDAVVAPAATLELFRQRHHRDLAAALRAVARVRAELGDAAVVQAELQSAVLPEEAHRWRRLQELVEPAPLPHQEGVESPPLIRRLLARARPLLDGPPDLLRTGGGALARAAVGSGRVRQTGGPHLVSSGWWAREQRRTYHFVEADSGRLLWVYYDEGEGCWYLQGTVE